MNHRVLLCVLLLALIKITTASVICNGQPSDVEYDNCDEENTENKEESAGDYYENDNESAEENEEVRENVHEEVHENVHKEVHQNVHKEVHEKVHQETSSVQPEKILDSHEKKETSTLAVSERVDQFYTAVHSTMTSKDYQNHERFINNPEKLDCIVKDMRDNNAMSRVDSSYFTIEIDDQHKEKLSFQNVTLVMDSLEKLIEDGNFKCTGMTGLRSVLLISVLVVCAACIVIIMRRRCRRH